MNLGIWVGGYVVNSLEERVDRWGLREGGGSPGEMCNPYPIAGVGAYEYMEDLLALGLPTPRRSCHQG